MRSPSGHQRGLPVIGARIEVNCTASEPSLAETQTSWLPERVDIKAILLPSGEYWGFSSVRVEAITGIGEPALPFGPCSSSRQILLSDKCRVYARRLPWREIAGWSPCSPANSSGRGLRDPDAGVLHRPTPVPLAPPEEKTISRPSGVQAGLVAHRRWKVSRLGSPLGVSSPPKVSR